MLDSVARQKNMCIFAVGKKSNYKIMTAIEMKYSLFKEIDSIEDESVLNKLAAFLKSLITGSADKTFSAEEEAEIPEAVRRMSVKTGLSGQIDAKEVMHKHWEEKYG